MYKTTKWIVATFCLAVLVFGCEVENVIQNNLTIDGFIFYATLMKRNETNFSRGRRRNRGRDGVWHTSQAGWAGSDGGDAVFAAGQCRLLAVCGGGLAGHRRLADSRFELAVKRPSSVVNHCQ